VREVIMPIKTFAKMAILLLVSSPIIALARRGWEKDDIQAGDNISVRCHQLRDGANGCLLGYVTTEGGVEKEWD
jgi:hypothetical protein